MKSYSSKSLSSVLFLAVSAAVSGFGQAPDLTINKTHTGKFAIGQVGASYTITVRNNGNGPTTGPIVVTDLLPAELTATSINGDGWNCTQPSGPCTCTAVLGPRDACSPLTLTVNVTTTSPASVINTASVTTPGDSEPTNNITGDPTEIVEPVPDLTITKSHLGDFRQGQTGATYSLVVKNNGTGPTAGTVTVSDTVPAGLTATGITGAGWNCGQPSGPCTRSDALAVGDTYPAIVLTVNVAANAPSLVTNTAAVSGGGETATDNNGASDPTNILAAPDLTVSKTHIGNFSQGQNNATYTVTVKNEGSGSTNGTVTLVDTPPAGMTILSMTGPGWNCTPPAGPCTRSDVLAGNSSYPAITVTVQVAGNATSPLTNNVSVSGGGELNTGNNSAGDPTTITPVVTCTLPESAHPYANNFDFTWTCVIGGNPSSLDVTFDPLTSLQTGDLLYVMDGNSIGIPGSPFTGTYLAGQTRHILGNTLKIRLLTNAAGTDYGFKLSNVVGVTAAGPDPTITKTHTGNFTQGQTGAVYTIGVSNFGTAATAGTVTVSDVVPAGLTATAISGSGWNCTQPGGPCTRNDALAPGASYPNLTLTVNVAANAAASLINTANVSGGGDVNPANNSATDPTTVAPAGPPCVFPESTHPYIDNFDFTWVCTFPGSPSSLNVTFDPLTFVEVGSDFLYVMDGSNNNIPGSPFTGGTLAGTTRSVPGNTVKIRLLTDVRRTDYGFKVTNIVPIGGNDPDMTITKTHSGNFTQGQIGATYTIVARNSGGAATSGVVTVTDSVPLGLTATAISGPGWSCTQPAGPCTRSDALPAGSNYPALTLTVNAAANAPASVTNTASVSGGGESNTSNNTASDPTNIASAAGCTLPESSHPYVDNFDFTWTCTVPGNPTSVKVTFDALTSVEIGQDFIYILDGSNIPIAGSPFTGTSLAGQTITVPGSTVKIRLVTDVRRTDYGFKVTSIVGVP